MFVPSKNEILFTGLTYFVVQGVALDMLKEGYPLRGPLSPKSIWTQLAQSSVSHLFSHSVALISAVTVFEIIQKC
jgi:hypothetical protein